MSPWTWGGLPWGLLPPPLCPVSALCLSWQPGATAVTTAVSRPLLLPRIPGGPQQAAGEGGGVGPLRCREPRGLLAACGQQMGLGLSLRMGNPGTSQVLSGVPAALPCQSPGQDLGVTASVPSFPRAAAGDPAAFGGCPPPLLSCSSPVPPLWKSGCSAAQVSLHLQGSRLELELEPVVPNFECCVSQSVWCLRLPMLFAPASSTHPVYPTF